jgi:NADPH:quinone reductase-like Zn-dependent oxidoreductase
MRSLIIGASGSVGTFAAQLAKYLGAEATVDYSKEDFAASGDR